MLLMQQQMLLMHQQLEQQRRPPQWWMWLAALFAWLEQTLVVVPAAWLHSLFVRNNAAAAAAATAPSIATAATETAAVVPIKGAAPFPSFVNVEGSRWASAQGAAMREPFWTSEGFVRLMWATNPKRVPPLRNTTELYIAARPASNLLVTTPDGNVYIGWSAPHDGFLYYADRSVRRCYLELAALRYARCCPGALPDPAAPPRVAIDAGTRRRAFLAQTAGVASSADAARIEAQLHNDSATSRILQRHAGAGVVGGGGAIAGGGSTMRAVALEEATRGARADRRAVLLRAHADNSRTVLDFHSGIVASNWPPQLRSLWMQRERLGGLSFQLVGKLAAALEPVPRAPPSSNTAGSTATAARRGGGVSVKYAFVQPSAGAATAVTADAARCAVDLRASHGMTMEEFTARRAKMLSEAATDLAGERRRITFAPRRDDVEDQSEEDDQDDDDQNDQNDDDEERSEKNDNFVNEDDYAGFGDDAEEEDGDEDGDEEEDVVVDAK